MPEENQQQSFLRDVAEHVIEVIRDDGVYRHIRFKKPGTSTYYFDLLTWPGCLCYTGDMGTYVFQRLRDMFEFFRTDQQHAKPGELLDEWFAQNRKYLRRLPLVRFKKLLEESKAWRLS